MFIKRGQACARADEHGLVAVLVQFSSSIVRIMTDNHIGLDLDADAP